MDDGDRVGELGEEGRFFERGVTAADHDDVLTAEEEPVAGGAPRDPMPRKALLVRQAELAVARTHGQDDGARSVGGAATRGDGLDGAGEVDRRDVVGDDLGAETLRLLAHLLHERAGP